MATVIIKGQPGKLDIEIVRKDPLDRPMLIGLEAALLEPNVHFIGIEIEWPDSRRL